MTRLGQNISDLKEGGGETEMSERDQMIQKRYEAGQEKLHKLRLLLVSLTGIFIPVEPSMKSGILITHVFIQEI